MRRIFPIAALALLYASSATAQSAPSLDEQYRACTASVQTDPEGTYKRARAWYGQSRSLASQHCMALALYGMKDYAGAANAIDTMLKGMNSGQGKIWMSMKHQAAKAHYASGNHTAADTHLSDALYWAMDKDRDADMVPLLLLRARIYSEHNQNLKAVQDFDHALAIRPDNAVLLQRAQLLHKMGMNTQALADADAILRSEPDNRAAQELRALAARR